MIQGRQIEVGEIYNVSGRSYHYITCYEVSERFSFFCPVFKRHGGVTVKDLSRTLVFNRNFDAEGELSPIKTIEDFTGSIVDTEIEVKDAIS